MIVQAGEGLTEDMQVVLGHGQLQRILDGDGEATPGLIHSCPDASLSLEPVLAACPCSRHSLTCHPITATSPSRLTPHISLGTQIWAHLASYLRQLSSRFGLPEQKPEIWWVRTGNSVIVRLSYQ